MKGQSYEMALRYLATNFFPTLYGMPWLVYLRAKLGKEGLEKALHFPDWSRGFASRLRYNGVLYLLSYLPAWAVFLLVQKVRPQLKFIEKMPELRHMLSELAYGLFSAVPVISAYQYLMAKYGRLPTRPNKVPSQLQQLAWLPLIVLYSDFHFYATHRMLHTWSWLYKAVHKLHHKSDNVNPLSGLSMHPLETMVYFSAILPFGLLGDRVPFHVPQSISLALLLYPIASHCGFHPFQRHHAIHHERFNYNYGNAYFWDDLFGTTYDDYLEKKKRKKLSKLDIQREKEAQAQRLMTVSQ